MSRQNRSRRLHVSRYPCGQIVRREWRPAETPDEILATVLRYREKHVGARHARSQLAGYALGRLLLAECITSAQHGAGWRWTGLAVQYVQVMGLRKPLPDSPPILLVAAGTPCAAEPDEEEIARVRRAYSDAYSALLEHEPAYGGVVRALHDCCFQDRDPPGAEALGNLRIALNVLCRLWREA